ncbi:hypothetical protein XENOCAPTIV_014033 [Xenoophorus captivus]|uniref:Uncharacterized protein n=1 Tax=Xenoophorus captivus TaxID=1517983 RepID=A0ABV0R8M9_9TELE
MVAQPIVSFLKLKSSFENCFLYLAWLSLKLKAGFFSIPKPYRCCNLSKALIDCAEVSDTFCPKRLLSPRPFLVLVAVMAHPPNLPRPVPAAFVLVTPRFH